MDKDKRIISRLHKIKGQIEAVERLYLKDPCDCEKAITQIQAARGALAKVASLILSREAERCAEKGDVKRLRKIVDDTFKTV